MDTLRKLAEELFIGQPGAVEFHVQPLHQDAHLARYLAALHRLIEHEVDALARQQAFAAAMTALLMRYAQPSRTLKTVGREPRGVRRAIDYANAHFSESGLSVNQLAGAAGLSVYHFMRSFRAATGLTAHGYVVQLRLQAARRGDAAT